MDTQPTENLITEKFPFRKLSKVSFIKGVISILFGLALLFLVKTDFKNKDVFLTIVKMASALGFLFMGIKSVWRGYKNEYSFSAKDIFDPTREIYIKNLLGQRSSDSQQLAKEYANIFRSKNFSFSSNEKGTVKDWQFIFYKLVSKKGLSDIFEYVPYPITNFISNQSRPVSLIGFFLFILMVFGFIAYLEIISFSMVWVNLFILIGLLTLWRPSKIDSVISKNSKNEIRNRILFFITFYLITIFLFKPYNGTINVALLTSILVLAVVIIYTSLVSFKLIENTFSNRKEIDVQVSDIDLTTHRVATQPNNIEQQFDNIIKRKTGWYFKSSTEKTGGLLAGDQVHKGHFNFEYVYETNPKLISTTYDKKIENKLSNIHKTGTILICLGLIIFFMGIIKVPSLYNEALIHDTNELLIAYAPKILISLFLILFGTAIYFFGNRLVYEIFLFFNTEIFFSSDLILFKAYGNYDEYEHKTGGMKRKDTFTDFTPDIEVCKVTSSIFVHPYLVSSKIKNIPRFVVNIEKNDELMNSIIDEFKHNLTPYLMNLQSGNYGDPELKEGSDNLLNE